MACGGPQESLWSPTLAQKAVYLSHSWGCYDCWIPSWKPWSHFPGQTHCSTSGICWYGNGWMVSWLVKFFLDDMHQTTLACPVKPWGKSCATQAPRKNLLLPAAHRAVVHDKEARLEARKRNSCKLLGCYPGITPYMSCAGHSLQVIQKSKMNKPQWLF